MLQTRASSPMLWNLIYFLLFHVHCFFWLQCMMDVYETNVSSGKQLQFVNLKMLVLPHLYLCSHVPPHPHPLNDLGGGGGGRIHCGHRSDDVATGQWSRSPLLASRRPPNDQHSSPRTRSPAHSRLQ